jgi:hypothetical protein
MGSHKGMQLRRAKKKMEVRSCAMTNMNFKVSLMKTPMALILLLFFSVKCIGQANGRMDTSRWVMYVVNRDTIWIPRETPFDLAMKQGEYTKAIGLLRAALKKDSTNQFNIYNLSCVYAIVENRDSAFYFLNLSRRMDTTLLFLSDPDMYSLIQDPRWEEIKKEQTDAYEKRNGKFANRTLTLELWEMHMKDQAFFRPLLVCDFKLGVSEQVHDSLTKIYQPLWENNARELIEIIQKSDWPKESEVGVRAAGTAFLVLQHADHETRKKYEPLIEAAANAGEAKWTNVAMLIDRICVEENKPQIYGSQVRFNKITKLYEPEPISDESNLDIRRKKVGLGTAANYYLNWKIKYTVPQNKEPQ